MAGALHGLKVVDFGQFIAGPLLAELLAQNGAEVIHVDPPGGPRLPGKPDALLNRGKKRMILDFADAEDRRVARELIQKADVVIENFRPGVMDSHGLGAEEMCAARPELIYCSLPGFAADDPRAALPAWEGVVMGSVAGYRRLAEHWDWRARSEVSMEDPERPLFTAIPIASNAAALLGALEVVVALIRRDRTGRGARLEVALSEAMLEIVGFHMEFPGFVGGGTVSPKPFLGSYQCSDGGFMDQVSYPKFVRRLLESAGVWDEWIAEGFGDLEEMFANPGGHPEAAQRFTELMMSRPAQEWEDLAIELATPFARVRTPQEWLASEHAREAGIVTQLDDAVYGPLSMAGTAVDFSRTPPRLKPRTLADAGERVTFRGAEKNACRSAGALRDQAPLAGISVVELSQVVAGPISGRLLADYGADVLKVANPDPHGNNGFHGSFTNRGKRTAFLDVQQEDGLATVKKALEGADVLLQNYAYGAVERYGLGYAELSVERPDLVYVTMSAYSRRGPWKRRRGHENQAVAATGLSSRYGGEGQWPIYQPYLISDVGTGILGALATVLGLFERNRSGLGQHVDTSLVQASTINQAVYLFDGTEEGRLPEPSGTDAVGWSVLQRLYRAADGWLFLGAREDQLAELLSLTGIGGHVDLAVAGDPEGSLGRALADRIREHNCTHWEQTLVPQGIGIQRVREIEEVVHDPTWHRRGIIRYGTNGEGSDNTPILGHRPAAWPDPPGAFHHPGPLGAHTEEILTRFPTPQFTTT